MNAGTVHIYKTRMVGMNDPVGDIIPIDSPGARQQFHRNRRTDRTAKSYCYVSLFHTYYSAAILYQNDFWLDNIFTRVKKTDSDQLTLRAEHPDSFSICKISIENPRREPVSSFGYTIAAQNEF